MAASRTEAGWGSVIRDFLVDGLGMILPGLGFLFACVPAIVLPMTIFHLGLAARLAGGTLAAAPAAGADGLLKDLGGFHLEILLVSVGLSYMAGHILFRQDIKTPDRLSFIKTQTIHLPWTVRHLRFFFRAVGFDFRFLLDWPPYFPADRRPAPKAPPASSWSWLPRTLKAWRPKYTLRVEAVPLPGAEGTAWRIAGGGRLDGMVRPIPYLDLELEDVSVEYPYHFLHEALTERGFGHLAAYIPWRGMAGKEIPQRTKHRINMLKNGLEFCDIAAFDRLARNEAHIRLASSVWYAAHHVRRLALFGVLLLLVAALVLGQSPAFLAFPVFALGGALYVQFMIEDALHYQRGREIIYVLHMVSLARPSHPAVFRPILGEADASAIPAPGTGCAGPPPAMPC